MLVSKLVLREVLLLVSFINTYFKHLKSVYMKCLYYIQTKPTSFEACVGVRIYVCVCVRVHVCVRV